MYLKSRSRDAEIKISDTPRGWLQWVMNTTTLKMKTEIHMKINILNKCIMHFISEYGGVEWNGDRVLGTT
jgi:hypothetical protein